MKKRKNGRRLAPVYLLLCLFWLLSAYGITARAETMYTISESELTTLENNCRTLEAHNMQKQTLLDKQANRLAEADSQLQTANEQIEKSKALNEQTQKSLERANQSLTELEKEAKKKIRVKTRQRNMWIAISGLLATVVIAK